MLSAASVDILIFFYPPKNPSQLLTWNAIQFSDLC